MDDLELLENVLSMERLKIKGRLIADVCYLNSLLGRYVVCNGKKIDNLAKKTIKKDFKKGLKCVNKKIPIFIELPKYKEYLNGMYTKEKNEIEQNNEVIVSVPIISDNKKVIKS